MILNPGYFKAMARKALKGDWQTPMLVTFFSGLFVTLFTLQTQLILNQIVSAITPLLNAASNSVKDGLLAQATANFLQMKQVALESLRAVPVQRWWILGGTLLLGILVTPVLRLGEKKYYYDRLDGQEPSVWEGLFSAFPRFWQAWKLYALIALKILLWGLLIVPFSFLLVYTGLGATPLGAMLSLLGYIPAFIAYLRFLPAPWILAAEPEMKPSQAIRESRELTHGRKPVLLAMLLSFLIWVMLRIVVESLLTSFGLPMWIVMVVSRFAQLLINVYLAATLTCLFSVLRDPKKVSAMNQEMVRMMREAGVEPPEDIGDDEAEDVPEDGTPCPDEEEDSSDNG